MAPCFCPAGPCPLATPFCLPTSAIQSNEGLSLAYRSEGEQQEEEEAGSRSNGDKEGRKEEGGKVRDKWALT